MPPSGKGKKSIYAVYLHKKHPVSKAPTYAIYSVHLPPETDSSSPDPPTTPAQLSESLPAITFSPPDFPFFMGFGIVGSSIYMIGGDWLVDWCAPPPLDVYILNMDSVTPPLHIDGPEDKHLQRGPSLRNSKMRPIVVSLLGIIYAIPSSIVLMDGWNAEFLEPHSQVWKVIPDPAFNPGDLTEYGVGDVQNYTVVGSHIVVSLCRGSVYELDGNNPFIGWKPSSGFEFLRWYRGSSISFQAVDNFWFSWEWLFLLPQREKCLSGLDVAKLKLGGQREEGYNEIIIPQPSGGEIGAETLRGERRLLDFGDDNFIIFTGGFPIRSEGDVGNIAEFRFILDVVRLQGDSVGEKKRKQDDGSRSNVVTWPFSIDHRESFKCVIGKFQYIGEGVLCGCFPMRELTYDASAPGVVSSYIRHGLCWFDD